MSAVVDRINKVSTLQELYRELDGMAMTPGWIPRQQPILWREPNTAFRPTHWKYSEVKPALDAAGRLIDTKLAERRNLAMRNPADPDGIATTRTLVSAYQMILPGEKARSHRHAPHALRVIIDAKGAYSTVQGEKTPMETGDIVLTPGWYWHGHGHDGDRPAYWYDGLDVPLNQLLEPMFFEEHPDGFEEVEKVSTDSPFRFTWDGTQRALDHAEPDPEGVNARRIQLDSSAMPTMGLFVYRLDTGETTRKYRTTANAVFCVMQGRGRTTVDGQVIAWERGDTFCAPCWKWIEHRADADSAVFMMNDEPLQRFAKFYRFETA
jgi:gentisate 1,2-dioxygenase